MCTQLFDVKQDYVFKKIFGSESHPNILISFLNACFKGNEIITQVTLKNSKIEKEFIEDSYSRLDILAETDQGDIINIEMQRVDEKNMVKRSLYYWSKTYSTQYIGHSAYEKLPRTVCINILDFGLDELKQHPNYHNIFRLQNQANGVELTDTIEIQFIELSKLVISNDDKLSLWSKFIDDANSVESLQAEAIITEIHEAREELARLSRDPLEAERYRMRENSLSDKHNALISAKAVGIQEGIEKGIQEGIQKGREDEKLGIAKKLLAVLSNEEIAESTGLTPSQIQALR